MCIHQKPGINIKPSPTPIILKGQRERYLVDGWKLHNELVTLTGFTWVLDIIDLFSKFMMSFPVKTNDAINALISIKENIVFSKECQLFFSQIIGVNIKTN